jgi:hypothetical protein
MGVNLGAIRQYYFLQSREKRRLLVDAMVPMFGFLFCLGIWLSLPLLTKLIGGAWLLAGIIYDAVKTSGFRTHPALLDFGEAQDDNPLGG